MASLLGTSSSLAIGKDRTIQWHLGTGTSRVESYLVMTEQSPQAYRATLQRLPGPVEVGEQEMRALEM